MQKPFSELVSPSQTGAPISDVGTTGLGHTSEDLLAAARLLDDVYDRAGRRYGDAVRRCILCEFDQRSNSLSDAQFRKAVYEGVVAVLDEDVKQFLGELP